MQTWVELCCKCRQCLAQPWGIALGSRRAPSAIPSHLCCGHRASLSPTIEADIAHANDEEDQEVSLPKAMWVSERVSPRGLVGNLSFECFRPVKEASRRQNPKWTSVLFGHLGLLDAPMRNFHVPVTTCSTSLRLKSSLPHGACVVLNGCCLCPSSKSSHRAKLKVSHGGPACPPVTLREQINRFQISSRKMLP